MQCFETLHKGGDTMDNEIAYRTLFNRLAQPDDKFDEEWVEEFEDAVIEKGEIVATHSWESDNPTTDRARPKRSFGRYRQSLQAKFEIG
jgi:hypothetical protein